MKTIKVTARQVARVISARTRETATCGARADRRARSEAPYRSARDARECEAADDERDLGDFPESRFEPRRARRGHWCCRGKYTKPIAADAAREPRSLPGPLGQPPHDGLDDAERVLSSVRGTILEISLAAELVGEVSEAEHAVAGGFGVSVERCGFHLDAENAGGAMARDVARRCAERRVGRPGAAVEERRCVGDTEVCERLPEVGA